MKTPLKAKLAMWFLRNRPWLIPVVVIAVAYLLWRTFGGG